MLKNEKGIISWLKSHIIKNYELKRDAQDQIVVDVHGHVKLKISPFDSHGIDVQFGIVQGDFICSTNRLVTLRGCPYEVGGDFDCSNNCLRSLEFCPQKVGKNFRCAYNSLVNLKTCPKKISEIFQCSYNKLTSLEGCPELILGDFYSDGNFLTSLEHCPKEVKGEFHCMHNKIATLEFCLQKVGKQFFCDGNHELKLLQQTSNFETIYQEHLRQVIVKNKENIENLIKEDDEEKISIISKI